MNSLRPHLREFVDGRLLRRREATEENLRVAIQPLIEDIVRETGRTFVDERGSGGGGGGGAATAAAAVPTLVDDGIDDDDDDDDPPMPSLEEMTAPDVLRDVTVVRGVDFHASLRRLYEARWLRLIATIYDDGVTDETFGANIYAQLCQCIHDFVGLTVSRKIGPSVYPSVYPSLPLSLCHCICLFSPFALDSSEPFVFLSLLDHLSVSVLAYLYSLRDRERNICLCVFALLSYALIPFHPIDISTPYRFHLPTPSS